MKRSGIYSQGRTITGLCSDRRIRASQLPVLNLGFEVADDQNFYFIMRLKKSQTTTEQKFYKQRITVVATCHSIFKLVNENFNTTMQSTGL